MKAKKMLLSITIYCLILLGCTACANRTASNKDKAEKQEDIVKVTETTRTNEVITSNSCLLYTSCGCPKRLRNIKSVYPSMVASQ